MIHKFEVNGSKIVLDVNTGAVHLLDDLAWDLLEAYEVIDTEGLTVDEIAGRYTDRYPAEDIREVLGEFDELKTQGLLFSQDRYQNADLSGDNFKPVVKSLCMNVSHDCNLRCKYCFAGEGHFGGERALMSAETGKKAIDFLIEMSGGRRHLEMDFFGGEPLMNLSVVKELVEYGKERALEENKEFKFTLTTNALLLKDEVTEYLNKEKISVVLSLDGRPEVNDAMRLRAGSESGSYASIMPRISSFVESRDNENYFVRGTYTRNNLDFSKDVLHLADLGYKYVSVEPVVGPLSEDWALREEDVRTLSEEYDKLVKGYIEKREAGKPFEFFHFNLDLNNGPCLPKRLSGCGAGSEYLAVTPEGDLYPCHQFVGREAYKLGNVDEGIQNFDIMKNFRNAHIYNKEKCRSCWAKFHCGGGCHANAEATTEDIMIPYSVGCELEKKRLECAIYIQVVSRS